MLYETKIMLLHLMKIAKMFSKLSHLYNSFSIVHPVSLVIGSDRSPK